MTNVVMATATGEEHGLINTLANSCQDNGFKHMTPENKATAEKMKKNDAKIVKARYINHRGNHERLTKPYVRYAGDPIRIYHLIPGQVYDLPLGFVNEINEPLGRPMVRSGLVGKDGVPLAKDTPADRLHELVPVSF
jgi:hypothetical protein